MVGASCNWGGYPTFIIKTPAHPDILSFAKKWPGNTSARCGCSFAKRPIRLGGSGHQLALLAGLQRGRHDRGDAGGGGDAAWAGEGVRRSASWRRCWGGLGVIIGSLDSRGDLSPEGLELGVDPGGGLWHGGGPGGGGGGASRGDVDGRERGAGRDGDRGRVLHGAAVCVCPRSIRAGGNGVESWRRSICWTAWRRSWWA